MSTRNALADASSISESRAPRQLFRCDPIDFGTVLRTHQNSRVKAGQEVMACAVSNRSAAVLSVGAAQDQIAAEDFIKHNIIKNIPANDGHFGCRFDVEDQAAENPDFHWLGFEITPPALV